MDFKRSVKERIVAYLQGELSNEEMEKLAAWISLSENNARYFARVKDIWEASLKDYSQYAETKKEWEKLKLKISPDLDQRIGKSGSLMRRIAQIAAVLTIGIITGSLLERVILNDHDNTLITSKALPGSIAEVILPDSSVVFLNSGSELSYNESFRKASRKVFLNGEAMFKVKNVNNKPFIVHTNSYNIKVLGTEFNVRAYDAEQLVETTLQKGSIMISSTDNSTIVEETILKPGEQLVYDKEQKTTHIDSVNAEVFTSWKEDSFSFSKLTLKELIIVFERRFGVTIDVKNVDILNYHYSGTIDKNETLSDLLDIVKQTMPIQYKINNKEIIIW